VNVLKAKAHPLVLAFLKFLLEVRRLEQQTCKCYLCDLNRFVQYIRRSCGPNVNAERLTSAILGAESSVIKTFVNNHLNAHGLAPSSINRNLAALKSFYRFLFQTRQTSSDPAALVRKPFDVEVLKPLSFSLTEEKIQALISSPNDQHPLGARDGVMLRMYYFMGLSVEEVVSIHCADLDILKGKLALRARRDGTTVKVPDEVLAPLRHYLLLSNEHNGTVNDCGHEQSARLLFPNKHGTRLSSRSARRRFDKYAKALGMKPVKPSHLRRKFIIKKLKSGADTVDVQRLVGHRWPQTTAKYERLVTEEATN